MMSKTHNYLLVLLTAGNLVACTTPATKPDPHPAEGSQTEVTDGTAPVEQVDQFELGMSVLKAGEGDAVDYQAAYDAFKQAAVDEPTSVPAHFNAALAADRLGKQTEAATGYRTVIGMDPEHKGAVYNLAQVEMSRDAPEAAIEIYDEYLSRYPDDPSAINNLATLQIELGNYDQAVKLSQQVLLSDPENLQAYKNLSRTYFRQGNYKLSILLSANALRLDDKDPGIYNDLGVSHLKMGNEPAAMASFKKALELDELNIAANLNLGGIALNSGDFYLSGDCFDRVLSVQPGNSEAQVGRAISLRGQMDLESAVAQYEQVLAADPNNDQALWNLAVTYHRFIADYDTALQLYDRYANLPGVSDENRELAKAQVQAVESDKVLAEEQIRLEAERKAAEEAAMKEMEDAKAPLIALIDESEKLIAAGNAPPEAVEYLQVAIDQAKQILELEDLDLMGEIYDYLKVSLEEFKAQQNPA